jgi:ribonucleoside-diphosphate reductase alpha chain
MAAEPNLSENALAVLRKRYLRRDEEGRPAETPGEMFARVARTVSAAEEQWGTSPSARAARAERFLAWMTSLEFLPNSPTLMNAGRPLGQLAACFVVPVPDTTEEIFRAVHLAAVIQRTGGGTGFSFSRLRPTGDRVETTGGTASGPVPFMQVFDVATEAIKQGGTRRGANMGILRVDHPDILEFVACKLDPERMRNFNLSVGVTDAFMAALEAGSAYDLVNPRTHERVRSLDARRVFDLMCRAAWATGDPGLVFLDRVNRTQPDPDRGEIEATNPCGEQPLLPYESCTLGSLNLGRFTWVEGRAVRIDWDRLREAVRDAVVFLDDVIDANRYPLPEVADATLATRKIGLGVMGFADLLIELGIAYDDPAAVEVASEVAAFVERESVVRSEELAAERGPFPLFATSRWATGELTLDGRKVRPLRNATTTTVAPTGTISIIAGCSSGIEPLYAVAYDRHVLDGAVLHEVHPGFRARAEALGILDESLVEEIRRRGGVRGLARVPADLAHLFPTAHEIPAEVHLRIQAAFQRHVHAAVSKTINLPRTATPADVAHAFRRAWDLDCKGVTVYRDGSRAEQVLSFGEEASRPKAGSCPDCGGTIVEYGGCRACAACGHSSCSS